MGNKKSKGSENDKLSDQGLFYRNILSLKFEFRIHCRTCRA